MPILTAFPSFLHGVFLRRSKVWNLEVKEKKRKKKKRKEKKESGTLVATLRSLTDQLAHSDLESRAIFFPVRKQLW